MNTFGSASLQFPLHDPKGVQAERIRFERDAVPELAKVNTFLCPSGRRASTGWVLLKKSDYGRLDKYSTALQLHVGSTIVLKNLAIVQAKCVTRGVSDSLYLVELTDARGVLANKWFQAPLVFEYNIRAPAYPETVYYNTLNSGTTWTWSTMLQNMWPSVLGAWPGLPITPTGTPEGLRFEGVPVWTALCDVLDYLGLAVACDLRATAPFTIVQLGASDASFTQLQTLYAKYLEDELTYIDTGAGRVPATVTVLFRRRNRIFGTEETVTYDNGAIAKQWAANSVYRVLISAPSTFSGAVGSHYIWSDFTVRYDHNSDPLPADTAIAATIAQERVDQYFAKVYHQTLGSMLQVYGGARPFVTGTRVDSVYYCIDTNKRHGWKTKIARGIDLA